MKSVRSQPITNAPSRTGWSTNAESKLTAILFGTAFARDQEREADGLAFGFTSSAGYDPHGAIRLLKLFRSLPTTTHEGFLTTHPSSDERLRAIQQTILSTTKKPVGEKSRPNLSTGFPVESLYSSLTPDDVELARIAEVMAIFMRDSAYTVEEKDLVVGCLLGLDPAATNRQTTGKKVSLENIIEEIRLTKSGHPKVPINEITNMCIDGMISLNDRESKRTDATEIQRLSTLDPLGGIGVEVKMQDDVLLVVSVIEGGPAYQADIRSGDILSMIDNATTRGIRIEQGIAWLRGKVGSTTTLTVERPSSLGKRELTLTRQFIKYSPITSKALPQKLAYLKISSFHADTLEKLVQEFAAMEARLEGPPNGLILDLRNNSGGLLHSCVGTASAFLPENLLIAETKGRTLDTRLRLEAHPDFFTLPGKPNPLAKLPDFVKRVPVVVLVNNETTACSEILAGALKEYQRATVIGQRTRGYGGMSKVYRLRNGDALKLTVGFFTLPNGEPILNGGIIPQLTLPQVKNDASKSVDSALQRATEILGNQLAPIP